MGDVQKPTIRQRFSAFANFVWNSETHQFLGRGARSWGEIGLFYLIYYTCLAGFFAGLLAVFYQTIDDNYPRLMGSSSLLKGNPGMGFKPMPDVDTTLIRYEKLKIKTINPYVKHLNDNLEKYRTPSKDLENCSGNDLRTDESTACKVDLNATIGNCGNDFGYAAGRPCILLKLNKIFDWIPEPFTDLPEHMPESLKEKYNEYSIWITCEGENPGDNDNLGPVTYYPSQGFPFRYYPFKKQPGYLSPLVMAHFKEVVPHVGIMVECKAWAGNIHQDRTDMQGSVHFELLID